jgi:hypothetical protein
VIRFVVLACAGILFPRFASSPTRTDGVAIRS